MEAIVRIPVTLPARPGATVGTGEGDLLQDSLKAATYKSDSWEKQQHEVYLRVETHSSTEARVRRSPAQNIFCGPQLAA